MRSFFLIFLFSLAVHFVNAQNESIEELKRNLLEVEGDEKIEMLLKVSEELSDSDLELAVKYANEALVIAEINNESYLLAKSHKQLGSCYFGQAKYNKSLISYTKSLQLFKEEDIQEEYSELYFGLGLIYTRKGLLDSSDICNDLALSWAKQTKDTVNIVAALRVKGNVFYTRGQFDDAVKIFHGALALASECKKCNLEESLLYNNFGVLYSDWQKFEKSLDYYRKSLKISKALNNIRSVARVYNNIGIVYWYQNKLDTALLYYKLSLELKDQLGDVNGKASVLNNIGMYFGSLEDFPKSLKYFKESLETYMNTSNKKGVALALFNIASVYQITEDFDLATKYYFECLSIAKNYGFTDYEVDCYEGLKDVYAADKDWKKAYDLLYKFKNIKDSIREVQNIELLSDMEAEFESENKRAKIKILEDQVKAAKFDETQATTIILGMVLGLFLIVFSGYLLIRQMRFKKQTKDNVLNTTFFRYQFNPEIIKSSLLGIKEILGKARIKESGIFLAGLAKLIRIFIETSSSDTITLEKEIDTTIAFLNLHQMRYDYELTYDINIADYIETDLITIPPFLVFSVYIHIVDNYLPNGSINTITEIDAIGDYLTIKIEFDYFSDKQLRVLNENELLDIIDKIKRRIKSLNKTLKNKLSFIYDNSRDLANKSNHMTLFLKLPLKSK